MVETAGFDGIGVCVEDEIFSSRTGAITYALAKPNVPVLLLHQHTWDIMLSEMDWSGCNLQAISPI